MPDKFEREIEDILNKLDHLPSRRPGPRVRQAITRRLLSLQRRIAVRLAHLSLSQVMLTGIALIFVGYFFRAGLPGIWFYLVILGLILFFTSFALSFFGVGPPHRSGQVYWRGRPASSYYPSGPSIGTRLLGWWRRRQGRRY
jgi:hypothetical protein